MYRLSGAPRGLAELLEVAEDPSLGSFLVLDFVDGPILSRRGTPFSLYQTVRAALQLCAVLRVLHRRGVVHGDIKPSNLIAAAQGVVLLDLSSSFRMGIGARVPLRFAANAYERGDEQEAIDRLERVGVSATGSQGAVAAAV